MILKTILVLMLTSIVTANMDYTYSPADLYRLIQTEQIIAKNLDEIQSTMKQFSNILHGYHISAQDYDSTDAVIKNPLLSYHLVKRHAEDFENLDTFMEKFISEISAMRASFNKQRSSFTNPDNNDVQHAMEAIIRLRQTYNLSVENLAQGQIGNLQVEGILSPENLVDIGLYAIQNKMKGNARHFLLGALQLYEASNKMKDNEWIQSVKNIVSNVHQTSNKPDREDYRMLTEMDAVFATDSLEILNEQFENLCQQHTVKEAPISTLKCYLDKHSHPMRQIHPLKIEVVHETPQIVVIYDFLSDSEILDIESSTFHKLKRSLTQVYHGGNIHAEPSIIRTTSQTWIYDMGHPQFGYLSKRIESITGYYLSGTDSAEELQVATYRPGGHYSLHTDATQEELLKDVLQPIDIHQGDRIATFMIYLSDVEIGGNTVFPLLSVSVKPVKGSAILWGNLYPDGKIARNTLHGACPVLYGVKNIATKWIRANDQMFTKQNCKPSKSSDHFHLKMSSIKL